MAAKDAEIKKRQQDRADADAKSDKEQADAKRKGDMCAQARGRTGRCARMSTCIATTKRAKGIFEPAERQKAIADNEKMMRDLNCAPAPAADELTQRQALARLPLAECPRQRRRRGGDGAQGPGPRRNASPFQRRLIDLHLGLRLEAREVGRKSSRPSCSPTRARTPTGALRPARALRSPELSCRWRSRRRVRACRRIREAWPDRPGRSEPARRSEIPAAPGFEPA